MIDLKLKVSTRLDSEEVSCNPVCLDTDSKFAYVLASQVDMHTGGSTWILFEQMCSKTLDVPAHQ